jgi:hypothetical protein
MTTLNNIISEKKTFWAGDFKDFQKNNSEWKSQWEWTVKWHIYMCSSTLEKGRYKRKKRDKKK